MGKYYYDLHIHSCLSACADDNMTPNNIVNMAKLNNLDLIAVTDHNSCSNCSAVIQAGENVDLLVLAGMELQTNEDIHAVCLFSNLDNAESFAEYISSLLPEMENNEKIFGRQALMDSNDNIIGYERQLLATSANISIMQLPEIIVDYQGAVILSHVDRAAYGIYSVLGGIPPEADFKAAEISKSTDAKAFVVNHPELAGYILCSNSDSHMLGSINERENNYFELDKLTPKAVIEYLNKHNHN